MMVFQYPSLQLTKLYQEPCIAVTTLYAVALNCVLSKKDEKAGNCWECTKMVTISTYPGQYSHTICQSQIPPSGQKYSHGKTQYIPEK